MEEEQISRPFFLERKEGKWFGSVFVNMFTLKDLFNWYKFCYEGFRIATGIKIEPGKTYEAYLTVREIKK